MSTIDYLRSFRVGPFAVFDFAASFVAAYVIGEYMFPNQTMALLWGVIPLSILAHVLAGKMTPLARMVMEPNAYWVPKLIVLFCVVQMVQNISLTAA